MKRWLTGLAVFVAAVAVLVASLVASVLGDEPAQGSTTAGASSASSSAALPMTRVESLSAGRVSGLVLGEDGRAAINARVTLRGATPIVAWSNDEGRFVFDGVPAGAFVVSASLGELASETVGPLQLASGATLEEVVLTLAPAVQVEGVVVDLVRRAPIAGALIVSAQRVSKADEQGQFRLSGARGATWLDVSAPGFLSRTEWVSLQLARTGGRLELVLTPASRLEGVVLESGVPVAGATVWAELLEGAGRGDRSATVFSGQNGGFTLETTAGLLRLVGVTPRGTRVTGAPLRLAVGEKKTGLTLDTGESSAVVGTVTRDRVAMVGAQVSAVSAANEDVVAVATTGPDGRFQFSSLTNGRYLVQVRQGGFMAMAGPFEQTGDGRAWAVSLSGGARLSGRVEPATAAVRVRWRSGTWSGPMADTVTDALGRFAFEGLPNELVSIDAEGPAGAATTRARPGDEIVLHLVRGQVTVHLADDLGAPLSDGVILSRSLDTGAVRRQLVLAPDGVAQLDLPAGVWELTLEVAGRGRSSAARVEVREVALDVRLTLERSTVVRGLVRDASNGLPIEGAQVLASSGSDGNAFRVAVATDARGEFTLPPCPVRAVIIVRRDGYAPAWRGAGEGSEWSVGLTPAPQHPGNPSSPPQQFEGVGMVLDGRGGRVLVAEVSDGGPAERAGVQRGDAIVAVDDVATAGLPLDQVVARIRGPAGTPVRLQFERGGQRFELTVRRRLLTL